MTEQIKTQKLYDSWPRQTGFSATILSVKGNKKGWEIVLDRTIFFPEEGGQSADTGLLCAAEGADTGMRCAEDDEYADWADSALKWLVTDVQIKDGIIVHTIQTADEQNRPAASTESAPTEGMTVFGRIDWNRRFSNMQNHSGEHILSGLIHAKYGFDNVGFHLSDHIATLDQSGYLSPEQLAEIEYEANRIVWANLPVTAEYVSPEEAKNRTYRSKIEIDGDVRLVTIGEASEENAAGYGIVDVCACCAPHVALTGEIGLIRILRSEKYKGGVRLTFLCGERAFLDAVRQSGQITTVSRLLRAKQEDVADAVQHLYEENQAQKERLNRLQEQKIRRLAAEALSAAGTVYDAAAAEKKDAAHDAAAAVQKETTIDCGDHIWIFTDDLDPLPHRNLVNLLMEQKEGYAGVFLRQDAVDEESYRFIIGSHTLDCREAAKQLREMLQAKGGGKPEMVQGSVCASADMIRNALKI